MVSLLEVPKRVSVPKLCIETPVEGEKHSLISQGVQNTKHLWSYKQVKGKTD